MKQCLFGILAGVALGLCGCAKPPDNPAGSVSAAPTSATAKPAASDEKIAQDVKAKLAADPALKNEQIAVAVKDGRVTLTGTISSDAVRIKAEDAAREVDEVFGVDAEKLVAKH